MKQLVAATKKQWTAPCPGLPGWAATSKVKPIWILLKQETVSGSDISWAICKSALRSRRITMPTPHHSVFYRSDALPAAQPTVSKHWRVKLQTLIAYWHTVCACVCRKAVVTTSICSSSQCRLWSVHCSAHRGSSRQLFSLSTTFAVSLVNQNALHLERDRNSLVFGESADIIFVIDSMPQTV